MQELADQPIDRPNSSFLVLSIDPMCDGQDTTDRSVNEFVDDLEFLDTAACTEPLNCLCRNGFPMKLGSVCQHRRVFSLDDTFLIIHRVIGARSVNSGIRLAISDEVLSITYSSTYQH